MSVIKGYKTYLKVLKVDDDYGDSDEKPKLMDISSF